MKQKADRDFSEGTYFINVMNSQLTDKNKAALNSVLQKATSQKSKDGVLEASYLGKTSYVLYRGEGLSDLGYLDRNLHGPIIAKLKTDILLEYGPEFQVAYNDGPSDRLPFSDVSLTLKWSSDPVPSSLVSETTHDGF